MSAKISGVPARLPMPADMIGFDAAKWRVLTDAIFPNARSAEAIALAIDYCKARGLDPLKRPVHIVPMYSTEQRRYIETVWPGINEIQTTAARTGEWAGMDAPEWGPDVTETFTGEDKNGNHIEVTVTYPEYCSVTVYRMVHGVKCPYSEPVFWKEAYARMGRSAVPNDMWAKRPKGQIHKCAKAAALRAAFPEQASYSAEEMEGKTIEGVATEVKGVGLEGEQTPEPEVVVQDNTAEPDMLQTVTLNGPRGKCATTNSLKEALTLYKEWKPASPDPKQWVIDHLPALRTIKTAIKFKLGNGSCGPSYIRALDAIENDIAAAEIALDALLVPEAAE